MTMTKAVIGACTTRAEYATIPSSNMVLRTSAGQNFPPAVRRSRLHADLLAKSAGNERNKVEKSTKRNSTVQDRNSTSAFFTRTGIHFARKRYSCPTLLLF
jgi:hypothetical protein